MDDNWIDMLKPNEAAASAEQPGKFRAALLLCSCVG